MYLSVSIITKKYSYAIRENTILGLLSLNIIWLQRFFQLIGQQWAIDMMMLSWKTTCWFQYFSTPRGPIVCPKNCNNQGICRNGKQTFNLRPRIVIGCVIGYRYMPFERVGVFHEQESEGCCKMTGIKMLCYPHPCHLF